MYVRLEWIQPMALRVKERSVASIVSPDPEGRIGSMGGNIMMCGGDIYGIYYYDAISCFFAHTRKKIHLFITELPELTLYKTFIFGDISDWSPAQGIKAGKLGALSCIYSGIVVLCTIVVYTDVILRAQFYYLELPPLLVYVFY